MRRVAIPAFLIGAAAMLGGCPPREEATISGAEIKQLSVSELAHRLLGASAAPFTQAMRTETGDLPLVTFATDPEPSETPGLCVFSQLWVHFKKVAADRYAVAGVASQREFLAPDKIGSSQLVETDAEWKRDVRDCAAQGPVISHDQLTPKAFKVAGRLAGGGTERDAAFAMRVLQAARTTQAAHTLPRPSCEDTVTRGESICGDPGAAIGAMLAHDPGQQGLTLEICRDDNSRVCVNLSDWPNDSGKDTTVSIKTNATSVDGVPDDGTITGIAITREPVSVL